jgi:tetratricopeptide (TPR) repeat protein
MKKLTLFFAMAFVMSVAYAQNSNVRKAESALGKGELNEAKTLIDEASKDEKTKDDGKTWFIKGTIEQAIVEREYSDKFLKEAVESYSKVKELEKEGSNYHTLAQLNIEELWGTYINKGSEFFTRANQLLDGDSTEEATNQFAQAVESFETALLVLPEDTLATLYAGVAAQQVQDNEKAMKYFYKLIELDNHNKEIYNTLISMERIVNKDDEKALKVINMAKAQFPEDRDFEKQEIALLIQTEQVDKAKDKLNEAIEKDKSNPDLYFNLGFLYEELEQPEKAAEAYLKAIEIDENYFDAVYNYAVFNFNIAADMFTTAANMNLQEYKKSGRKIEDSAKVYLEKSKPYFEKAMELRPDDLQIVETLQTVYSRLGEKAKSEKMMNIAEGLRSGGN